MFSSIAVHDAATRGSRRQHTVDRWLHCVADPMWAAMLERSDGWYFIHLWLWHYPFKTDGQYILFKPPIGWVEPLIHYCDTVPLRAYCDCVFETVSLRTECGCDLNTVPLSLQVICCFTGAPHYCDCVFPPIKHLITLQTVTLWRRPLGRRPKRQWTCQQ